MDATDDQRWRQCEGTWDRLRWARMAAGYERAKDFADSINMKDGTYRTYERPPGSSKHSKLETNLAVRFGTKLDVRWEWLLTGDGSPWAAGKMAKAFPGRAKLQAAVQNVPEDKAAAIAEAITALLKIG